MLGWMVAWDRCRLYGLEERKRDAGGSKSDNGKLNAETASSC